MLHTPSSGCADTCAACRVGHEGARFGRLDPADYCAACAEAWRRHDRAIRDARVRLIRALEEVIREDERVLKTTLKRLPD